MQTLTLDALIEELPHLKIVVVHGEGQGGGEILSKKIKSLYNHDVDIVKYSEIDFALLNELKKRNEKDSISILFTAGLRDVPAILKSKILGLKIALYLTVPYHKAATIKDPFHFLIVYFSQLFFILSDKIYITSRNIKILFKQPIVMIPIKKEENYNKKRFTIINKKKIVGVTASRLNIERGVGSRDIDSFNDKGLEGSNDECHLYNEENDNKIELYHFGEVETSIQKVITSDYQCINFLGYDSNWQKFNADFYFFFSRYEGFGLAPLESSQRALTIVNKAFPDELVSLNENIISIDTSSEKNLLKKLKIK